MAAATTKTAAIPAFEPTAIDEIPTIVETLRRTYSTNRTKDLDFRINQIRKLYWSIVDNIPLLEEALYKDLRKSKYEATLTEIDWCKAECLTLVKELKKWAKDEPVVNVPLQFYPMRHKIRNEPMGLVLIISAYNYPIQLSLPAVAGAIAAGNCVVLKPSESSPHSAMVLQKIFQDALDPECYRVVNGNVAETKQILDLKWDKISFTGGKKIGTIVAQKAAETLTPVLLELGGCNPAFVNKGANVEKAARRLLWGKTLNSGQVCLSQNYILIDRTLLSQFIGAINKQYKVFMPKGAKASPDYARLGNKAMFDKCKRMLDNTKGRIVMGGTMDGDDLFIEPTVVLVDSIEDSMMVDESFGPIFSIMAYDSLDQAIEIANKVDPTPLSLFTFGSDAENEKILSSVTSGGATCNDSFMHCSIPAAPIGGVGSSGTGNYHGYYSFKAFSHQRAIADTPNWAEALLRVRYMPYMQSKLDQVHSASEKKPDFDRNGKVIKGLGYWIGLVAGLGGKTASRSAFRWALLVLVASMMGLKKGSLGL